MLEDHEYTVRGILKRVLFLHPRQAASVFTCIFLMRTATGTWDHLWIDGSVLLFVSIGWVIFSAIEKRAKSAERESTEDG